MRYIDTHFHLDLWVNPQKIAEEIERFKTYTIAVTNTPSVFDFTYKLAKNKKYLRAGLGLHPELVYQRFGELSLFMEFISMTKYIGEVGLDFSGRNIESKDKQIKVFDRIIDKCAVDGNKIITIHSRKAEKSVIDMIGSNYPGTIMLHWYSGSLGLLEKAISNGFYFSVNYQMVNSINGRNIIKMIPLNRLLIESDGPFVSADNQLNNPLIINKTYDLLIKKFNFVNIKSEIYNNFKQILKSNVHNADG